MSAAGVELSARGRCVVYRVECRSPRGQGLLRVASDCRLCSRRTAGCRRRSQRPQDRICQSRQEAQGAHRSPPGCAGGLPAGCARSTDSASSSSGDPVNMSTTNIQIGHTAWRGWRRPLGHRHRCRRRSKARRACAGGWISAGHLRRVPDTAAGAVRVVRGGIYVPIDGERACASPREPEAPAAVPPRDRRRLPAGIEKGSLSRCRRFTDFDIDRRCAKSVSLAELLRGGSDFTMPRKRIF